MTHSHVFIQKKWKHVQKTYNKMLLAVYSKELTKQDKPKFLSTNEWSNCGVFIQWNIIWQWKEQTIDTCHSMDESQKHCAMWKRADTKYCIILWFQLYNFLEKAYIWGREIKLMVAEWRALAAKEHVETFGDDENYFIY